MLTSSSAYMAGGPQGPVKFEPLRHDMAPRPMLAPIPIAPFLTEGRTITRSARSRIGLGRLSGMFRISISTSPALFEPFLFFLLGLRNQRQNQHRPWFFHWIPHGLFFYISLKLRSRIGKLRRRCTARRCPLG